MVERVTIDLNCDLGEGFGPWSMGEDAHLLDQVTSANIACGFHAGDPATMLRTARLALDKGVAVGAHPSFPDLQGFGRREMKMAPAEIHAMVLYQMGALSACVRACGGRLRHVKAHGALYNMASRDRNMADAIVRAVREFDDSLTVYGLSGSVMIEAARAAGLKTASEVFADRRYQADGSLVPRSHADALIHDVEEAVEQVMGMVRDGTVRSVEGDVVKLEAATVCVHGDAPGAVDFARRLRQALRSAQILVRAPD